MRHCENRSDFVRQLLQQRRGRCRWSEHADKSGFVAEARHAGFGNGWNVGRDIRAPVVEEAERDQRAGLDMRQRRGEVDGGYGDLPPSRSVTAGVVPR